MKKIYKNLILVSTFACFFSITINNICNASFSLESDLIHIKTELERNNIDKNSKNNELGLFTISKETNDILNTNKMKKNIKNASSYANYVFKTFKEIDEYIKNQNFDLADSLITELANDNSNVYFFQKWAAIYFNKINKPLKSLEYFNKANVLNIEAKDDFLFQYYKIDNYRRLGNYNLSSQVLNEQLKKYNVTTLNDINVSSFKIYNNLDDFENKAIDIKKFLLYYQKISLDYMLEKDFNKDELYDFYHLIPKNCKNFLNNFYSFDITEINYMYGIAFERKDLIENYVKEKSKNNDIFYKKQIEKSLLLLEKFK